MHENNMRLTNRRVIFMALAVWFVTQALFYLEPFGAPDFLSRSLSVLGFVALPALVIWPLMRTYIGKTGMQRPSPLKLPTGEQRGQALICAEIAALSAMLIYLMSQRPQ